MSSSVRLALLIVVCGAPVAALAQPCPKLGVAEVAGLVQDAALTEISGMVASRAQPGVLWAHNDSGDTPTLYALATDGRALGRWHIPGAIARDWEDIAIAPCSKDGDAWCLLIADIGNNCTCRDDLVIYEVPEPRVDLAGDMTSGGDTAAALALRVRYPYGDDAPPARPDAEALLADPQGALYIVTKEAGRARVLHVPARHGDLAQVTLEHVGELEVSMITAGDLSADGREVALREYGQVLRRVLPEGEPLASALLGDYERVVRPREVQGESVAWALPSSLGLWTASEGRRVPLHFTPCAPQLPVTPGMDEPLDAAPDLAPDLAQDASEDDASDDAAADAPEDAPTDADGNSASSSSCSCASLHAPAPRPWGAPLWALLIGCGAMALARRARHD